MPEKKSSKPSYMQRCVGDLIAQGKDKEAAFAICTSTMQKAGYLTKGPDMKQTKKGANRARHFSMMKDMPEKAAAYEKGIGRKTESVLGGLASTLSGFADAGLTEASIAKMNRRAKAGSKSAPSANQKPYNSLSKEEKKVVDRQVAADAKGFMDGYGKVERTTDGPMLVIEADPIKEYVEVDGMESSYEDNAGYTITVPDDFAIGTFKVILQPYLVGFNKVKYEVTYYESMGSNEAEDPSPFRDDIRLDDIAKGAESAIAKGGLPAFERLIKEKVPSVRQILAAFDEHLQDNAGDY